MAFAGTAPARYKQMDMVRKGFINRCEIYAAYTLPKLCLPDGYLQNNQELSHDYQAVGAQSVNHLANKIMLAGFAPSRPFFRLDPSQQTQAQMDEMGVPADQITNILADAEKASIRQLDKLALRPKLYEAIKHLIVIGNVLIVMDGDTMRVVGIKNYVVRRSMTGKVIEIMLADKMLFDELIPEVKDWAAQHFPSQDDREITLYRWIKFKDGDYHMTQWIDNFQLPKKFNGKWNEENLPYRPITWDLSDGADYGTGLVEDYSADFNGLSTLSTSMVQGAVLASEFRWLVNPAGMTKPEDFANLPNGSAMPGQAGDVELISNSKASDLQVTINMAAEYINRIGRGFLLGSQIVRDAERVTAEEIRLVANELETALGGAYSRLAVDLQSPLAAWLLSKLQISTKIFEPTIVTGLDALSRAGDLDDLRMLMMDLQGLNNIPDWIAARLNPDAVLTAFAAPRRVDIASLFKSQEQMQQEQAAQEEQEARMAGVQGGIDVAVDQATQQEEEA